MPKFTYVGKYSDGGSQNSFYRMVGMKKGFKSFPNKSLAIFAHTVQNTLSQEYLAPYVYSPVCKIRVPNYFIKQTKNGYIKTVKELVLSDWGYITEIAEPFECESDPDYCDGGCAYDNGCVHYDSIRNLVSDIEAYGLDYIDAHNANLGYVKRGKKKVLVVIDVGAESVVPMDDFYPSVCWDGSEDKYCDCEQCMERYENV